MAGYYPEFPNLNKMSASELTSALEATCMDALSCGWHPERMKDLLDSTLEHEQYELTEAILRATERFKQNPQLALFKFDVPEKLKEPLPVIDPLAFLNDYPD